MAKMEIEIIETLLIPPSPPPPLQRSPSSTPFPTSTPTPTSTSASAPSASTPPTKPPTPTPPASSPAPSPPRSPPPLPPLRRRAPPPRRRRTPRAPPPLRRRRRGDRRAPDARRDADRDRGFGRRSGRLGLPRPARARAGRGRGLARRACSALGAPGDAVRVRGVRARDVRPPRHVRRRGRHQVPLRRRPARARSRRTAGRPGLGPVHPARPAQAAPVELPRFNEIFDFDERVASRGPYDAASRSGDRMARECFHVSNTCAERLRNRLVDESPTGSRLTTFEALSAFIWRARVRTTGTGSNNEIVKMVYSMNISKILNPPLPAGYWGNVCVPAYVRLTAGELAEQPLSKTAVLIRESKRDVTDEYVRSYIDFQELNYARGITAGGRSPHSPTGGGWDTPTSTSGGAGR
uniref:Uncharacterized protein n=1 Tax=Ananas comosus var. bracteatus TaxID=296719 RepID=A0A6V7NUG1_ANACO|nr:unnamed protein product [Ananas comosus var. bracteatus]